MIDRIKIDSEPTSVFSFRVSKRFLELLQTESDLLGIRKAEFIKMTLVKEIQRLQEARNLSVK